MKKEPIVEIEEIGYPKSLVIRHGSMVSELILTSELILELNELLKSKTNEA